MQRRDFFGRAAAFAAGFLTPTGVRPGVDQTRARSILPSNGEAEGTRGYTPSDWRALFPRMERDVFLNAAGGTPLSRFSEHALDAYSAFWKFGGEDGRDAVFQDTLSSVRGEFAHLIGANTDEIALVSSTKEGEQIILDSLKPWDDGGRVVTNVFHFSGSLHSYEGHRRAGRDIRIVESDGWRLGVDRMLDAIDAKTRLVALTLVSNINGRIEDIRSISDKAHAHGALVFADIIQGAGIYPLDVQALGIDAASCSAYKWLYGPHGVGFLFVRRDLQGTRLADRLFPGHALPRTAPWTKDGRGGLPFIPPSDASRYEPGHHSYMGYACALAGLRFIRDAGVDAVRDHAVALALLARERIDTDRFPCISPDTEASPIVTFDLGDIDPVPALINARVVVAVSEGRMRVSPGVYNNEDDILRLAEVVNSV